MISIYPQQYELSLWSFPVLRSLICLAEMYLGQTWKHINSVLLLEISLIWIVIRGLSYITLYFCKLDKQFANMPLWNIDKVKLKEYILPYYKSIHDTYIFMSYWIFLQCSLLKCHLGYLTSRHNHITTTETWNVEANAKDVRKDITCCISIV